MSEITYRDAGVNIDEGDRFVRMIAPRVRKTFRPEVMTGIGSFAALFKIDTTRYREPVLVSGTDGVGTKLKIAFMMDAHATVGIDLVAMCVNDILTLGAEPLFFLDYLATGRLQPEKAAEVIKGITDGCLEAGCSLIGGETAEMPGFYAEGEYDLAGFAVGIVEKSGIVDGRGITAGDALIGIESNGLHSNGYSLVRKVLLETCGIGIADFVPELGGTLGEELLRPTRIYVRAFNALKDTVKVKGMAHITGGGIPGNLPRMLPQGLSAVVRRDSWPVPPVFRFVQKAGNVPPDDLDRTFNMGIGFIMAVPPDDSGRAISAVHDAGYQAYVIGSARAGRDGHVVFE